MQPTLLTERLMLRPRSIDDLEACLAMDREPEVLRYVAGPREDPAAHRVFVAARIGARFPTGMGYWTVTARDAPARFLGWVCLIPVDGTGPEIEIGWRFQPAVWGRGIATEAARRLLAYADEDLGIPRIVADIHDDNAASRRVAEKAGLVDAGPIERGGVSGRRYVRAGGRGAGPPAAEPGPQPACFGGGPPKPRQSSSFVRSAAVTGTCSGRPRAMAPSERPFR